MWIIEKERHPLPVALSHINWTCLYHYDTGTGLDAAIYAGIKNARCGALDSLAVQLIYVLEHRKHTKSFSISKHSCKDF